VSGLTAFLAARLDEDTDDIEASIAGELESLHADGVDSTRDELLTPIPGEYEPDLPRRLREVEAKRSLIEDHTGQCCVNDTCCGEIAGYFDSEAGDPCPVLLVLAAIYSDHPDYRQEWAVPSLA